jgi:hypothetical protein
VHLQGRKIFYPEYGAMYFGIIVSEKPAAFIFMVKEYYILNMKP